MRRLVHQVVAVLAAVAVLTVAAVPALAQQDPQLTVDVSQQTYNEGDTVIISGSVATVVPDTPVIIQVISIRDGNIVNVEQIIPAEDGSFIHTLKAEGPLWKSDDEYVVRASYGTRNLVEASFEFMADGEPIRDEGIFEVEIPDSASTVDVGYSVTGGSIAWMEIDDSRLSLVVHIDPEEDGGTLTVDIPRDTIDAKTNGCEGGDEVYIVRAGGIEVPYQETDTTRSERTVQVEFKPGESEVEIIGTCVVPEFGAVAAAIMAVSVASAVTLSRRMPLGSA